MSDENPEQLFQRAQSLWQAGNLSEALPLLRRVTELQPDHAEAHHILGLCLSQSGRLIEGESLLRTAIRLRPDHSAALNNLGTILARTGRLNEAVDFLARACALRTSDATALLNLGNAYTALEQYENAIDAYKRCVAISPQLPEANRNLGLAHKAIGQFDEAFERLSLLLVMDPGNLDAMNDIGSVHREQGNLPAAEYDYRRAISTNAQHGASHWNLALLLLYRGDMEEGWQEYEWRRAVKESGWQRLGEHHPSLAQPRWDGSPAEGKTLFIYSEQGFGDTFQFVRYLPMVKQTGAKIILGCQSALIPLLKNLPWIEECLPLSKPPPPFDAHCPLMSLPLIFKTTLNNIPAEIPYITSGGDKFRDRLAGETARKIGLVWAGRKIPDPRRSIPSAGLSALADIPGVRWFSLQKEQSEGPPPGLPLTDWTAELTDFAATADLIANLDLVITIDTAVAHLAGAMGKPVWVLLPFAANWRWMEDRTDSPWYPTMRLFRQVIPGNWQKPVLQIAEALKTK